MPTTVMNKSAKNLDVTDPPFLVEKDRHLCAFTPLIWINRLDAFSDCAGLPACKSTPTRNAVNNSSSEQILLTLIRMTKSPLVGYAFIIEDHAQTQSGWDMKLLFGGFIAVILLGLYGYAVYEAIMVVMCISVCRQNISDGWLGNLRECLAHLV